MGAFEIAPGTQWEEWSGLGIFDERKRRAPVERRTTVTQVRSPGGRDITPVRA